jgi:hypothetical protein
MLSITFAESMRLQFTDSYEKDGPAEMLQGSGIMNYHLVKESDD